MAFMKNVPMLWARIIFVNMIFTLFSYMSVLYFLYAIFLQYAMRICRFYTAHYIIQKWCYCKMGVSYKYVRYH